MFHIVFDSKGAELLNTAMDLDEALDGEIVLFLDDYSLGPIKELSSADGLADRKLWWEQIGKEVHHPAVAESDSDIIAKISERMRAEEFDQIWIWVTPNSRDVSGYYWMISQLQEFAGRIFILSLNNLPFINDKGSVFYPVSLSEIPAREFVKAKKLARLVTLAEFETDPDEWQRLASENKNLRLLEGGKKIMQQSDDYFDKQILHFIQPAFQKIQRTVQQILLKFPEKLNETFLTWRIRQLVLTGIAEQQGEMIRLVLKEVDEVDR